MSDETTMTTPPEWTGEFDGASTKAGRRLAGAKLDAARSAVATLDGVVKWAAYEDETDAMEKSLVVTTGPALKALGDGKIGGYLVMFGDATKTDLSAMADYFTPDTDFDLEDGTGKATVLYHHGMDATLKRRKLGRADLRTDEVGVWMESQLALRDDYERAVYSMVEAGKMGLSSGTAPHLVEREAQANGAHKITRWPLGLDASITPIPAEPRTSVRAFKTYLDMAEPYVKALSQAGATQAPATEATAAKAEPDQPTETGEYEMTPEEIRALIAQTSEATIKAYEAKLAAEPAINPAGVALSQPATVKAQPEPFKSLGEQLDAIRRASTPGYSMDRRLAEIKAISGMSETVPEDGGYLVQTDFATELLRITHETGLLASRTAPHIPIGPNSDGLEINAVAETSRATGSRWGGVQAYWRAEADTVTASKPKFRRMKLELQDLMGVCYATDKLLADTTALGFVIQQAFAEEFAFLIDNAIIRGSGNGQPLGILNSGAYVSVTKETNQVADTIYWENIVKMWNRLWSKSRTNAAWYIHQDALPQLQTMAQVIGVGGVPVYMPATGAAGAPYSTLMGRPVIEIEQADTVGDQGDIMLLDLSQYLMIDKDGLEAAQSIHVRFLYGENTFRFILRTDGQPIWNSPLTLFNSSTTVSPFVLLDARA